MSWQTLLTLVPVVVVAVFVPWFTFRLALRQARIDHLRDSRADLYVDLLTEAIAEQKYFDYDIADDDARAQMRAWQKDLRLPQAERAKLGARGTIFASRTVTRLYNQFQGQAMTATLIRPQNEVERLAARLQVGRAFDALETQVRREMGADDIEPKEVKP